MAKKKFTGKDEETINSFIGTADIPDISDISDISDRRGTKGKKDQKTGEDFRFSARFSHEAGLYLEEKKWKTRKTITAILQELVEEDMKKHPEILEGIDELNY